MAIQFPATPALGASIYYSGRQWTWDGTSWNLVLGGANQTRWSYLASGGETTLSGVANTGTNTTTTLSYVVGNEEVYLNGVLMVRGNDYTATTQSSITFASALLFGDVVDVISYNTLTINTTGSAQPTAKGDLSVGVIANVSNVLNVGADGTILAADSTATVGMSWQDYTIVPLDNLYYKFDGIENRFYPTYQGNLISITNPLRILITINGIIQTVSFPEYVWQSGMPMDGFMVDSDGYIAFSEAPPAGSTFYGRIEAGSNIVNYPTYPFKAVDILLGA
jgi:hypothetical protein